MPDITDLLQRVGQAKYISSFDVKGAYWNIPVHPDHQWLTASTPPLSFLQAGCPSCRPTNSVKALKAPIQYNQSMNNTMSLNVQRIIYKLSYGWQRVCCSASKQNVANKGESSVWQSLVLLGWHLQQLNPHLLVASSTPCLFCFQVTTLGNLFTHTCLSHQPA